METPGGKRQVVVQKKGIATIGITTAIFCGLLGVAHNTQAPKRDQTVTTVISSTVPDVEEEPVQKEPPAEGLPNEQDVAASVHDFQSVIDKANTLIQDFKSGSPSIPEESSVWRREHELWVAKNSHLIERCELWLGQDGTETYSSLSLSCENLQRGSSWLQKAIESASIGHYSESRIYLAGASKAVKKARAVLRGEMNPRRRTATVKTPRDIRA